MRTSTLLLLALTALLAAVLVTADGRTTDETLREGPPQGTPQAGLPLTRFNDVPSRSADGQVFPRRAGRLPLVATHPDENRHAVGTAVVSPGHVSGLVLEQQVLLADVALPWRYWLDPVLIERFEEPMIHSAVAAWDDLPGSRWRSDHQGVQAGTAVADGRSTIFLEATCAAATTANTYLFTDGGLGVDRNGSAATQILEADIGVCPRVTDAETLVRAIRHEVGHVVGLGHLCDPDDSCWAAGMGEGSHACRVMFWQARRCQTDLDEGDRLAVAALYPTLRPLSGPTPADTTAWASFAMLQDRTAPVVVVVAQPASSWAAAPAAVLAARRGGPLLLADVDPAGCMAGVGAREVSRVLAHRGSLVLVGDWPDGCARVAHDWDVQLRRIPTTEAVSTAQLLADLGGPASQAVVVDPEAPDGSAIAAAWLAARLNAPLLPDVAGDRASWLAQRGIGDVIRVGGAPTAGPSPGVRVRVLEGTDVVDTALRVAADLPLPLGSPVVVVSTAGGVERFAAIPVAGATGAVLALTGADVDPRVSAFLSATAPVQGWTVGLTDALSPAVQAAYGSLMRNG